ncbi:BamA/TamA family outer membrane protein [filamentous cyanobacterium LEGE 11480]|uniref:BamA/TamA family outer membrane protein n=1 Tax=Romeriopsis navalis LEGE 11480 TaxID=2777977 RepID=A0A928Z3G3_9CYAN|nr:BamA/TamA family outer membrane protein [Romeriopsis navalis]MBE9030649.1 BamA/TamA family outer membrane protein [Romeriopsis navalis LEGE 11480]
MNRILLYIGTIAAITTIAPAYAEPPNNSEQPLQIQLDQPVVKFIEQSTEPIDSRVLVAEVVVRGVSGPLEETIYQVIKTQPGQTTTKAELQADVQRIFDTGRFARVRAEPADTPLGVRVTFFVEANPVLQKVVIRGRQVLPETVISEAFQSQYGQSLNFRDFQTSLDTIAQWYKSNGYVLAQFIDRPKIRADGVATIAVAEGSIEAIQVQFLNAEGKAKDASGKPIRGGTRDFIITREMETKPGDLFNRDRLQRDLQRIGSLGIFKDLKLKIAPGQDPRQAIVVIQPTDKLNLIVRPGFSWSSRTGFGVVGGIKAGNFGGNNQQLNLDIQAGTRNFTFDTSFTDPWIAGDPFRTSYTVRGFRSRSTSLNFEGGDTEVNLANGDRPRILRTGGAITFTRPLSKNVFKRAEWTASLGLKYQQITLQDADRNRVTQDAQGNALTASGTGRDDFLSIPMAIAQDKRNNPRTPTNGSLLRLSSEQSIPIGRGKIFSNTLRASYSKYLPTKLTRFTPGCRKAQTTARECPQTFALNLTGGTVLGKLPPYNAFSLGGSNSVRGYEDGEVGSARSFLQASAEYRFPIIPLISGTLFLDAATDLGSGSSVIGNPGGARGKSGNGFGYGLGARINSPLGPIRIDYGWNDRGDRRVHFGFGERF